MKPEKKEWWLCNKNRIMVYARMCYDCCFIDEIIACQDVRDKPGKIMAFVKQNGSESSQGENSIDNCTVDISLCKSCYCMTKTIAKCGKCGERKPVREDD